MQFEEAWWFHEVTQFWLTMQVDNLMLKKSLNFNIIILN